MIVRMCACLLALPLLLCAAVGHAAPARSFDVLDYNVALVPDIAGKRVQGTLMMHFRAEQRLHALTLDSGALTIASVQQDGRALPFEQRDSRVHITLAAPLPAGDTSSVRIVYAGAPPFGLEFAPERDEVYTVFSTSQWMPSVDAPDERARLALSVTLPPGLLATGTGRALPTRTLADGRIEHRWQLDTPMPGYVYGFAAGRYQHAEQQHGSIALRFLSADRTPAQLQRVFARTGDMLDYFAARAGIPYQGDYAQVLVSSTIGQEMAGLSLLSEDYGQGVLDDPDNIALMAHEAAHQWWGKPGDLRQLGTFLAQRGHGQLHDRRLPAACAGRGRLPGTGAGLAHAVGGAARQRRRSCAGLCQLGCAHRRRPRGGVSQGRVCAAPAAR